MQLHFSPSMRSVTISSSNGFSDLMKIKVAARHISYRTLFHTILILACLLPFLFILTALVTLEGANKCSSFGNSLCVLLSCILHIVLCWFDSFLKLDRAFIWSYCWIIVLILFDWGLKIHFFDKYYMNARIFSIVFKIISSFLCWV